MTRARATCLFIAAASALLVALALRYDFFCDDAFITLRYARNLAHGDGAVYNPGERVEGYTSFVWMLLAAASSALGLPAVLSMQVVGALSGAFLLVAAMRLWQQLQPEQPAFGAIALLALVVSAPLGAWTMGGLETPLFAALVTWSIVLGADLARDPTPRRALALGAALGVATLTRPEGLLVAVALGVPLMVVLGRVRNDETAPALRGRASSGRVALAVTIGLTLLIVGAHLWWRMSYYGYPLPNTFYVKSSGDTSLLRARGAAYVAFAARELGVPFVALLAFGLLAPVQRDAALETPRRVIAWTARLLFPTYIAYVVTVGGDFLDLYRFFVPLLPVGLLLATSAVLPRLAARMPRNAVLAIGIALLATHAVHQKALAERALQVKEPERAKRGIEPLGWTRLYARRWAAIGRWIAAHAERDDWMAVGAAGAMPYFAGIANLDTFGLCDAWVAHEGPIVGNRPGHQRFAPESYILSKAPVFLLIGNDYSSDEPRPLRRDRRWEQRGYVWAEARIDAARFGAPETFYHYLLMRRDRAEQHAGSNWLRFK
jgi:arabinofuranosyltransferase